MEKVYLVYFDNGMNYEDHYVHVSKVFASKESADKYAEEQNAPMRHFKCSVSKEDYYKQDSEYIRSTYEEYVEMEQHEWMMLSDAKYYVSEEELHP
jgi:hypothetical protein